MAGKKTHKDEVIQELADIKFLMDDKRGRRVVWRLLENAGVYRSSFAGGHANCNELTNFNEGLRSGGLFLLSEIMVACDEQWLLMTRENGYAKEDS